MEIRCPRRYETLLLHAFGRSEVTFGVHPDAVITEDYCLKDGTAVHVIVGEEEQNKLLALQKILDEGND